VQDKTEFNPDLASKLNADKYGMRKYVLAYLKEGPNRDRTKEESNTLQRAHLDNISKMAADGKLSIAGPFLDTGEVRGIYIFNTESIEEAERWANSDPAIKAGSLILEMRLWYGSAALQMVNEWHKKIEQTNVAEQF